jgi:hypothetical protein
MARLLLDSNDWYAISRRAELYVVAGHLEEAVREFERAGIEAHHRALFKESSRAFALAARTARAATEAPGYIPDGSFDEDSLERTAARCRRRAKADRLRHQRLINGVADT